MKRGRPKLKVKERRQVFALRLTPEERVQYIEAAALKNKPISQWIRETLTEAAQKK